MQIPLLSGIKASEGGDFNLSYPVNLEPVATDNGISAGYLRSASGARAILTGPGIDRGGILWNGLMHRVMGTKLVSIDQQNQLSILGDVGSGGPVAMDYGFGMLAIQSGTRLYYWNGTTLTQVTDPDLGPSLDVVWMDGYYISTDGNYIVVTQLSDPTQVDPLKYGSAEDDPDMITGLIKVRDELFVTGMNTIQVFNDAGGSGFPFVPNLGATIPIGCVAPRAKCVYLQSFAFCGSARNQALGIWLASSGTAQKLSTRMVDDMLAEVADPTSIVLEARVSRDEHRLVVHLPDKSLIYCANASQQAGQAVWYIATSGRAMDQAYRPRFAVSAYNQWYVGDAASGQIGVLDDDIATHFGEAVGWMFDTKLLYNGGKSAIIHSLELVGLPGRGAQIDEPVAFLSYTPDGETWGMERACSVGRPFQRTKRVQWRPHKRFRNYLALRFRGDSSALAGWAALEANIEALAA